MKARSITKAGILAGVAVLGAVAGCGGSRNSSSPEPIDYSLGDGDVEATWTSHSTDFVHDAGIGQLYYPDAGGRNIVAIDVDSGRAAPLIDGGLPFVPEKIYLTADNEELYVLESKDSAQAGDGLADIVRYSVAGRFLQHVTQIARDVTVTNFVATNDDRVIVVTRADSAAVNTSAEQFLTLLNAFGGGELDRKMVYGLPPLLALSPDQSELLFELMPTGRWTAATFISMASDVLSEQTSMMLAAGMYARSTYEPQGNRIFRSSGVVWDDNEDADLSLGSNYESIAFDVDNERVLTLVRKSGGAFTVRYADLDSLELLHEEALPAVTGAAGMEPVQLFLNDGDLHIVYRQVKDTAPWRHVLAEFDYPD
jgi:hypothetical protein